MSEVTSREMIFIIILAFLIIIPMRIVQLKYSLGTYILFSMIVVTLVAFAELIYYKGDPPKRPYRRRSVRPFTRDPVFITAVIAGITSLILLNILYK
jgi:hypothetical protein